MDPFASISQTMVSKFIRKICRIISRNLAPTYINFPQNASDAKEIKQYFLDTTKLPGIVGIVDGTHIPLINVKRNYEYVYVNRKGFHSVNTQIICDGNLKILNCNARYPGSCHDSHIFESSRAFTQIQHIHNENNQSWILGDSAYASKPYMVVPYRNPRSEIEKRFNEFISKIRVKVERCIGLLKGRWRCLTRARGLHYNHETASHIIYATII